MTGFWGTVVVTGFWGTVVLTGFWSTVVLTGFHNPKTHQLSSKKTPEATPKGTESSSS